MSQPSGGDFPSDGTSEAARGAPDPANRLTPAALYPGERQPAHDQPTEV